MINGLSEIIYYIIISIGHTLFISYCIMIVAIWIKYTIASWLIDDIDSHSHTHTHSHSDNHNDNDNHFYDNVNDKVIIN